VEASWSVIAMNSFGPIFLKPPLCHRKLLARTEKARSGPKPLSRDDGKGRNVLDRKAIAGGYEYFAG
jgi:hypothetical protein